MRSSLIVLLLPSLATAFQAAFVGHNIALSRSVLNVVDDKTEVREYFNTEGFNRWNKIYSESDEVNSVQLDIRTGHDQTIQKILNWVKDDGDISGKSVCDCGCGVGSLAIPLAQMGADVSASDISDAMSSEAARRAESLGISNANFYTSDLESVEGKYDTVSCVDVAIHYPTEQMAGMIGHLCELSDRRVIFSFAPKTWWFVALKKIGELFPGPSKTTRAYLHEEEVVKKALEDSGFKIAREEFTGTNFYFSKLFEAVKA
ncbi:hypothetical protein TrRE_jg3247 [Triparma retinervis]|uniref:Magnesium-protoporphyrin IX methyltransferase C-terminal domain-containing protein n=1 Tax=Triparma retinervis TaxID=2557542 RepID=A0A9W7FA06_9STRA|nr:hypothetical protein TrRE_jg3247 [Triparma retinervis]